MKTKFLRSLKITGLLFLSCNVFSQVSVNSTTPIQNAIDVANTANLGVTFSENIKSSSLTTGTIKTIGSNGVPLSFPMPSVSGQTATFDFDRNYFPGEQITTIFTSNVEASSGALLTTPYIHEFTTGVSSNSPGEFPYGQNIVSDAVNGAYGVYAADLDGDGDLDILATAFRDDKVAWYQNDGTGTFSTEKIITNNGDADRPIGVYAADLDNDGDLDVLSASTEDDKIAWYENVGTGNFEAQKVITNSAGSAVSVSAADLNGDGYLDVLSAAAGGDTIDWYQNNGDGTFSTTKNISTLTNGAYSVYAADIDNDGDLDVLSASSSDDKIAWYENDGTGTFGTQQIIVVGADADAARCVYAADFNGDGYIDVLSASQNNNRVAWYANNGDGTFGGQQIITNAANGTRWVHAADMDGDGDMDVISTSPSDNTVSWHQNNGTGTFATAQIITTEAEGSVTGIYASDLDNDGDLDVIAALQNDNEITWYENAEEFAVTSVTPSQNDFHIGTASNIELNFNSAVKASTTTDENILLYGSNGKPFSNNNITTSGKVTIIDPDRDYLPGEVVTTIATTNIQQSLGAASLEQPFISQFTTAVNANSSGLFPNGQNKVTTNADGAYGVYAADFDGDGDLDLLSASFGDDKIAWYANDGSGNFGVQQTITTNADRALIVYVADLDGDGNLDVLSASYDDDKIAWYQNDGSGNFGSEFIIGSGVTEDGASSVFAADLDGDGDLDVLTSAGIADKVSWYVNDGDGNFGVQQTITTNADGAFSVYAADIDNDGDLDVLSASSSDDKIAWYANDGSGNFGAQQTITTNADGARKVYAADLDSDGDLDVLSASLNDDTISWYQNDGSGNFGSQQVITDLADATRSVHAVDLDGDGDLDVISGSQGDDKVAWYENQGGGTFGTQQVISTSNNGVNIVYAADLDGDGDMDIIAASQSDDEIAWYENGLVAVSSVEVPTAGVYETGEDLDFTINFHQEITVATSGGTPELSITIGSTVRQATYVSGSSTSALVFRYTVQLGDEDTDGIAITSLSANGGSLQDASGNTANLTLNSIGDTMNIVINPPPLFVDSIVPSQNGLGIATNATIAVGFTGAVASNTVTDANLLVYGANGPVFSYTNPVFSNNDQTATITRDRAAYAGEVVTTIATKGVESSLGTPLEVPFISQFTTGVSANSPGFFPNGVNRVTAGANEARSVYAADLDGDGYLDVLSASLSDDKIAWYKNDGAGSFSSQKVITTSANGARSVYAADLDGDGDLDVLSASEFDNKIAWYENLGSETFSAQQVITSNEFRSRSVYAADLDGDGDLDVLSASFNKIFWYKNDGTGIFSGKSTITTNAKGASSVYAVDLDGDGDLDVLSASESDDKIAWYENDGSGSFGSQQVITRSADGASSVYAADLDGNGDLDVLSASFNDDTIAWYKNNGDSTFTEQSAITESANGASSVYATDMDGDGDLDVLSASFNDDTIAWYKNNGDSTFTEQSAITESANGASSVYAADLDADGDLDVLSASQNDDKIAWYENGPAAVSSVEVPTAATYVLGENLDFTINFKDAITVATSSGTPELSITIGSTTRQATYVSGSSTSALVFRYTVQSGDEDTDGIAITSLAANGGSLQDTSGNAANLTLNNIGDTSTVLVDGISSIVNSVLVPTANTYILGENIDFTINFDQEITVATSGGTPELSITIGSTVHQATYVSGSSTSALVFRYTVQSGDEDTDGIAITSLSANGGSLQAATGNAAILTLNNIGDTSTVLVDGVVPAISSILVPTADTYILGENLDFAINFDSAITVVGTPELSITIGSAARQATYVSGNGTTALLFSYTVQSGDEDTDGIAITSLSANGGSLLAASGNAADLTLNAVGSTSTVLVDGIVPAISSVLVPTANTYILGENLDFTINFDSAITVVGIPELSITIGSTARQATYVSGSGTTALLFSYTVQSGDEDTDGIVVDSLSANSGSLQDASENTADLTLNNIGDTSAILVDSTVLVVTSVLVPTANTYILGEDLDFTINFDSAITVVGTPELSITIGSTARQATYVSGSGTTALVFRYTVQSGDEDTDGIAITSLSANGGSLQDASGKDANLTLNAVESTSTVLVDGVVPAISSVLVPTAGIYETGEDLDFTINFDQVITVTTSGGTPELSITIGSTTRQATYVSGSATSTLLFSYTVQSGDDETDGIVVASLSANGGSLQDASGNAANLTLNSVDDTMDIVINPSPLFIDSIVPSPNGLDVATNATITVGFTEAVASNTITDANLLVYGANGPVFSYTNPVFSNNNQTVTITRDRAAYAGEVVTTIATKGIESSLSNPLEVPFISQFTTGVSANSPGFFPNAEHTLTTSTDGAWDVYAADLDGDGDLDVLSASVLDDKIAWYENDGSGTFGSQQVITTSANGAYSVYAADLDGDGDLDVLSASFADDTIAWYENDGSGIFGSEQVITTSANGAQSVYASDLDGDGDLDVLSASVLDDKIAWYENDGSGTFGSGQVITTSADGANSVYAADLDGDGDLDVLSASLYDNKIAWYKNNGDSTFTEQSAISTSADTARSVYAVDLDGDGDLDVLSASSSDDTIAWYVNNGDGTFGAEQIITTSADGAYSVYAADMDGDGDMDVLSASTNDATIAWYVNNGDGTFGSRQVITTSADSARSIYASDLDGDGDMDVLSTSYFDDKVAWYENTSQVEAISVEVPTEGLYKTGEDLDFTINFHQPITVVTTGGTPALSITIGSTTRQATYVSGSATSALVFRYTVVSSDKDTDGITIDSFSVNGGSLQSALGTALDLTLNGIGDTSGVLVNGFFVESIVPSQNELDIATNATIAVGFTEAVASNTVTDANLLVYGTNGPVFSYTNPVFSNNDQTVTITRDRAAYAGEVVTTIATKAIESALDEPLQAPFISQFTTGVSANSPGFFPNGEDTLTTSANGASSVYAADLDGDGDLDVLSASFSDDKIAWYVNNGDGTFTEQPAITTSANGARSVYASDLDGDGDLDVLSASSNDDKIAWYENDGDGTFTEQPAISESADQAQSVYAADLDGDGDLDVLSASVNDDKIAWYVNNGDGTFGAEQVITTSANGVIDVYAADLDGDGDMDVLSASSSDNTVAWYENDGTGIFGSGQAITTSAYGAWDVYAADMDGDGDLDVLSASVNDDTIAWYENNGTGNFTVQPAIAESVINAQSVYAADLDGDGDMDVLSAIRTDDKVVWYENIGDGIFGAEQVITTSADGASSVYAADLDGDGDLDVLSASAFDDKIAWYENAEDTALSIDVDTLDFIRLYPNPATYQITLSYNGAAPIVSASIVGVNGQVAKHVDVSNFKKQQLIDLKGLSQGVYLMEITSTTHRVVKKIIIR